MTSEPPATPLIRRATLADVDALLPVINDAFEVEKFFKASDRITRPELIAKFETGTFLAAEVGGRVVGAVWVDLSTHPRGYFGMLAVAPGMHGRGIGKALTSAAEDLCRDAGCTVIDIRVVNLRTELPPLYEKLGYHTSGVATFDDPAATQPAYFIVMSKPLANH